MYILLKLEYLFQHKFNDTMRYHNKKTMIIPLVRILFPITSCNVSSQIWTLIYTQQLKMIRNKPIGILKKSICFFDKAYFLSSNVVLLMHYILWSSSTWHICIESQNVAEHVIFNKQMLVDTIGHTETQLVKSWHN